MSTMKDVAKLAGVSHGTVSNVLNGSKGVSLDKVKRVQKAMVKLGYKPNAVARNLKLNKTMQFDLIIPNILDPSLAQIYESLSMYASEKEYTAHLQITNEDPELETKLLNQALMYNKDGVILMTCQPNNTDLFERLMDSGLKIVFILSQLAETDHHFVGLDVKSTVSKITDYFLAKNKEGVAIITGPTEYTFETLCLTGYIEAHITAKQPIKEFYCETSNYDRQAVIKEAFKILTQPIPPKVIIATCHIMVNAIIKAMELLNLSEEDRPLIVALVAYSWSITKRPGVLYVMLPYVKIAELAFEFLMEDVNASLGGYKNTFIKVKTPDVKKLMCEQESKHTAVAAGDTIRVLLTQNNASLATKMLLPDFEKQTGIKVAIDMVPYFDNYEALERDWYQSEYDVWGIDIPWLSELAQKGVIENLDDYLDDNYTSDVPYKIFNDFTMFDGSVYAIPFTICTQQLFYRKDLFGDLKNQRLYYEQNKKDLAPPKNWQQFNEVARFFTKEFNKESPTAYGTTLGAKISSGAVCEFLPRLWGFGSSIGETGFDLNNEKAVLALENYIESFKYASKGSYDYWWEEQVLEFSKGDVAMMIMFADQISDVTVRSKSKVNGKVGYADIPGGIGTLGGWSIAINAFSKKKKSAFKFLDWASSQEMSVITTILGGCVPCQTAINDFEVSSIYPWLKKSIEVKQSSNLRAIPQKVDGTHVSEHLFEEILGEAIHRAVIGETDAKSALSEANEKLNDILK